MSRPSISTEPQAREFLQPFKATLSGAIRGAFDDWAKLLAKAPTETGGLTAYVRRRFIHDRTVFHLTRAELEGLCPGLRLEKKGGLYVAVLRDQMILKLKNLDARLRSKNIPTAQTRLFDQQGAMFTSDVGAATNATSGYLDGVLSGGFSALMVVCWDGDTKLWDIRLDEAEEQDGGPVVSIPAAPIAPAASGGRRTRVVRPKPTETKQAE